MLRILGIDPGSRITGYGIIQWSAALGLSYIASGCIRTEGLVHAERLKQIFEGVQTVIQNYGPSEAAVEQIFMYRNPSSALKLGQARGAALTALALSGLAIAEYAPRLVKQSVVGYGAAEKGQVQHMVRARLALSGIPQADAADALAIALCHSQHLALSLRIRETS